VRPRFADSSGRASRLTADSFWPQLRCVHLLAGTSSGIKLGPPGIGLPALESITKCAGSPSSRRTRGGSRRRRPRPRSAPPTRRARRRCCRRRCRRPRSARPRWRCRRARARPRPRLGAPDRLMPPGQLLRARACSLACRSSQRLALSPGLCQVGMVRAGLGADCRRCAKVGMWPWYPAFECARWVVRCTCAAGPGSFCSMGVFAGPCCQRVTGAAARTDAVALGRRGAGRPRGRVGGRCRGRGRRPESPGERSRRTRSTAGISACWLRTAGRGKASFSPPLHAATLRAAFRRMRTACAGRQGAHSLERQRAALPASSNQCKCTRLGCGSEGGGRRRCGCCARSWRRRRRRRPRRRATPSSTRRSPRPRTRRSARCRRAGPELPAVWGRVG